MTHEKYTSISNKEWQSQIKETEMATEWFHSLNSKIPNEPGQLCLCCLLVSCKHQNGNKAKNQFPWVQCEDNS